MRFCIDIFRVLSFTPVKRGFLVCANRFTSSAGYGLYISCHRASSLIVCWTLGNSLVNLLTCCSTLRYVDNSHFFLFDFLTNLFFSQFIHNGKSPIGNALQFIWISLNRFSMSHFEYCVIVGMKAVPKAWKMWCQLTWQCNMDIIHWKGYWSVCFCRY